MEEIQKCPFEHVEKELGHKPYKTQDEHGWYIVQCTCGARGPFTCRDMELDAWNRPTLQTERDKLKRAIKLMEDFKKYIKNGIELGYIILPEKPDEASYMPERIEVLLKELKE